MGERGRFWEGRTCTFVENQDIFWEGGVDSERVAYIVEKGGIFWAGGVDYGRVLHMNWLKRGVYFRREGSILAGSHIIIFVEKGGIFGEGGEDSGRVAYSC